MITVRNPHWREEELSLKEVQKKYTDVPKSWILKADMQRRGITFSQATSALAAPKIHLLNSEGANRFRQNTDQVPNGLIMRDGSYLVIGNFDYASSKAERTPYLIDVVDVSV